MQKNWIGRSIGAEVDFSLGDKKGGIRIFTTRPDTLFGATYMVLAPEHPLVEVVTTVGQKPTVSAYRDATARKSDLQRQELEKEKTGVFTGGYAINPVNGERLPIWIADYALMSYGTGAIMAVPAHDERDWASLARTNLRSEVIAGGHVEQEANVETARGKVINSNTPDGSFSINGLTPTEAIPKITAWLESTGKGKKAVNYRLRDWLFARQRYWGEPFPIVNCPVCDKPVPLPESALPLVLPETKDFKPEIDVPQQTDSGHRGTTGTIGVMKVFEAPLARVREKDGQLWKVTICPQCGGPLIVKPTQYLSGPALAEIFCDLLIRES
jgi:leucyl-tRNA synthetase